MRKKLHYDWHWVWDSGNGDLGNQGIHEMDKARWGLDKNELAKSVVSVGGRFGYVDDGQTANTQICVFDYGDCELIFEVRGWPSKSPFPGKKSPKDSIKPTNFVGNIFYGSEGFLVCPSYTSAIAYTNEARSSGVQRRRRSLRQLRQGRAQPQGRGPQRRHPGRPSVQRPVPPGQHQLSPRRRAAVRPEAESVRQRQGSRRTFERMEEHLKDNKIALDGVKCRVGRKLTAGPGEGDLRRRQGRQRHADARVSQGLRGAGEGLRISSEPRTQRSGVSGMYYRLLRCAACRGSDGTLSFYRSSPNSMSGAHERAIPRILERGVPV